MFHEKKGLERKRRKEKSIKVEQTTGKKRLEATFFFYIRVQTLWKRTQKTLIMMLCKSGLSQWR